jgi:hypothetical protein
VTTVRLGSAVALVLVALVCASATDAAQSNLTIVVSGPRADWRIGSFHFLRDAGLYPAAASAFGPPSSRAPRAEGQSNLCSVRWARLGLQIDFASTPANPCAAPALDHATWFGARIDAGAWQTDRGLRLGDSLQTLHHLYPSAAYQRRPPRWLLVAVRGEVGTTVFLQAQTGAGRVVALELPPGNLSAH